MFASGSYDGTIILWDTVTNEEITTLMGHKNWVRSVCFQHKQYDLLW